MPAFPRPARRAALLGLATLSLVAVLMTGTTPLAAEPAAPTAAAAPKSAPLAEMPEVKKAEAYLNGLRTLKARFTQTDSSGKKLSGDFLLKRPGRMRFQYDPPMTDFIVADGTFVYYYDGQMKQQSSAPIGRSLANFFLRSDIGFTKDLRIESVQRDEAGKLAITLTQEKDPLAGSITLLFHVAADGALMLAGWHVLDPQGLTTDVTLENPQSGIKLDNDMFHYYDPQQKKPRYN